MKRKNLFDEDVYREIRERIDRLTPDSEAKWGSMTVAQMLAHCAEVQRVNNGAELRNTPFYMRLMPKLVKRLVLSKWPFPRNMMSHPQYVKEDPAEFERQKTRLLEAIDDMISQGRTGVDHGLFGELTAAERGWGTYKHLDHHLRQFGV